MAKAVPVFKFAFAAYAVTGSSAAREQREFDARKSGRQAGFLRTWSVYSSEDGLMVKIGVRDGERCEAVAESKDGSEEYREVWLGEIRATANAFSGVVRGGKVALRYVRPGQRIGFDPTHILDWSIGCGSGEDCAPKTSCETVNS